MHSDDDGNIEELFRLLNSLDEYKNSNDPKPDPDSRKFVELLKIAKSKKWITETEFKRLIN